MRQCSVVGCKSLKFNPKTTLFKVQTENKISWTTAVYRVNGQTKELKYVCSEHFSTNDILTTMLLPKDITLERKRLDLKKGVIPTIFKDLSKLSTPCRKELFGVENSLYFKDVIEISKEMSLPEFWMSFKTEKAVTFYLPSYKNNFEKLQLIIEKQIVFNENLDIDFYINQNKIDPELGGMNKLHYPIDISLLAETIQHFHSMKICQGGPDVSSFPGIHVKTAKLDCTIWRHKECTMYTKMKKRCIQCEHLYPYFRSYYRRSQLKNQNKNKTNAKKKKC